MTIIMMAMLLFLLSDKTDNSGDGVCLDDYGRLRCERDGQVRMVTLVVTMVNGDDCFCLYCSRFCSTPSQIAVLSRDVSESAACWIFRKPAGKRMSQKESQAASDLLMRVCWQNV